MNWEKLEKVSQKTIGKAPFDGKTVLLAVNGNIYTGYYGGVNSGWRHNAPGRPAMWPEPTHWMEIRYGETPVAIFESKKQES